MPELHNNFPSITFNTPLTLSPSDTSIRSRSSFMEFRCSSVAIGGASTASGCGNVVFLSLENGSLNPVSRSTGPTSASKLVSFSHIRYITGTSFLSRDLVDHLLLLMMHTIRVKLCLFSSVPGLNSRYVIQFVPSDVSGKLLFVC